MNQRTTEQGRSDTEFGLRFTYNFSMPWDEQTSHSKVAQMRTVGGSCHEFVDRENRMILEYKAKDNYHVDYLGKVGTNQFKFRIRNAFDKYVSGQTVRVNAGGGVTLAEAANPASTSLLAQAGEFIVRLDNVQADGLAITATPTSMQVGEIKSITFTLTDSNGLSVNSQPITSFVGFWHRSCGSLYRFRHAIWWFCCHGQRYCCLWCWAAG